MKKSKKLLSLILVLSIMLSLAAPMMTASAAYAPYPVVYVEGSGHSLYSDNANPSDENKIFPIEAEFATEVKKALEPCLKELAAGAITGNYDKYCDELYNAIAPIYDEVRLDKNGEASDGSGCGVDMTKKNIPAKTGNYNLSGYYFEYDWRLSPITHAEQLKDYIDRVKAVTGKDKVCLVGRCLGGNVVAAYLTTQKEHAEQSIDSVLMYISSAMGFELIGNVFSGKIKLNSSDVETFANYFLENKNLIDDPVTLEFVTTFISVLEYASVLGVGTDMLQMIFDKVKDNIVPRLVRDTYGSFPSYWSMCNADNYLDARNFAFKGVEEEYAGMIEKTDAYYYDVQLKLYDTIEELESKGINTSVIAKYNLPMVPVYDNASEQGDVLAGTKDISFGATCAPYNSTLSDSYIDSLEDSRFVSSDKKIDASTCLIPERTWFIKNIAHAAFPGCINELILEIFASHSTMTVFDNEKFPQYLDYDETAGTITPVSGLDEEPTDMNDDMQKASFFIRFFTALMNFLKKLFSGEIDLGGLLGGEEA